MLRVSAVRLKGNFSPFFFHFSSLPKSSFAGFYEAAHFLHHQEMNKKSALHTLTSDEKERYGEWYMRTQSSMGDGWRRRGRGTRVKRELAHRKMCVERFRHILIFNTHFPNTCLKWYLSSMFMICLSISLWPSFRTFLPESFLPNSGIFVSFRFVWHTELISLSLLCGPSRAPWTFKTN